MADGLRDGWSDIFLSDSEAHKRSAGELTEIFKNVTGKSESVATKMATTFSALSKFADFTVTRKKVGILLGEKPSAETPAKIHEKIDRKGIALRNDIHIHLPTSSDVAVYTAIFRAIREELLD